MVLCVHRHILLSASLFLVGRSCGEWYDGMQYALALELDLDPSLTQPFCLRGSAAVHLKLKKKKSVSTYIMQDAKFIPIEGPFPLLLPSVLIFFSPRPCPVPHSSCAFVLRPEATKKNNYFKTNIPLHRASFWDTMGKFTLALRFAKDNQRWNQEFGKQRIQRHRHKLLLALSSLADEVKGEIRPVT